MILIMWPITKPKRLWCFTTGGGWNLSRINLETWLSGLRTQKADDLRRKFPRKDFRI